MPSSGTELGLRHFVQMSVSLNGNHHGVGQNGGNSSDGQAGPLERRHRIYRAQVGTVLFILSEIMLFAGLSSVFVVVRDRFLEWPPSDLPRYPVEITLINTVFLLASGVFNWLFRRRPAVHWGWLAIVGGLLFVVLQGIEWIRLIQYGLTFTVSVYASIFYVIVGCHALHVLAGLLWYFVGFWAWKRTSVWQPVTEASTIFWFFVVLVWLPLYFLVFFS